MKNIFFFLLFIFVLSSANSQTNLDSLYNVWQDKTQTDTTRVLAFKNYIDEGFFYTDVDSAITLTNELFKFSEKVNYEKGMVDALSTLGYAYFRIGNYTKALESYQTGLDLAKKSNNKKGAAYILLKTGYIYHDNGDLITALSNYKRSLKIFEEIEELNGIGSIYNEFGNIYSAKKESDKAIDYFQKSIAINKELDSENDNSAMYLNIGRVYLDLKDFPKAMDYFQKGLAIYEKEGEKLGIASGLGNIGDLYILKGDYNKALEYLLRSLKITEDIDDIQGTTANLLAISEIYSIQGKYEKAIKSCKMSLTLAVSLGDLDDQLNSCDCLFNAYKEIGKGNEALVYHEQMLLLSDSLKIGETAKEIQSMEFAKIRLVDSLSQVEKDLKVEMAHQTEVRKKNKNKNLAIGVGIFFLFLSGGLYGRWRYVKKSKAIIEKEKNRSENLLLNILPSEIAEELKLKGSADARDFDLVSVIFTDFKDFTKSSEKLTAKALIAEINHCFMAFDHICEKYGIEKIKTIGDAYMAVGGLPVPFDASIKQTVLAALEMQSFITERIKEKQAKNEVPFEMRLGIHSGPVVAGIVGVKKFQYDIWGDTVNTAARMESSGEIGKVNISKNTYDFIKDDSQFSFVSRGKIQVKSKGEIEMFFVTKQS